MTDFLNPEQFYLCIKNISTEKRINFFDAVIEYCRENDLDVDEIIPLLNRPLKEKIKADAMQEGMVKQEAQLPI